jgi:hypothetical protein
LEDDLIRVAVMEHYYLMDVAKESAPKHTRGEQLAVHAIIDGAAGAFDRVVGLGHG